MGANDWFNDIINRYSDTFIEKLLELLRSINDIGNNAAVLLKDILTNPDLKPQHIEEMITHLSTINENLQAAPSLDYEEFKSSVLEYNQFDSQLDVLNKIIISASKIARRVALFIISGDKTIGWLAWGFSDESPAKISRKKVEIPSIPNSFITRIRSGATAFKGQPELNQDNARIFQELGGATPAEIVCIPLITKRKVSGVLYLDQAGENIPIGDTSVIEIEMIISGMIIDLIPIRKNIPKTEISAAYAATPAFQQQKSSSVLPFQRPSAQPLESKPAEARPFAAPPASIQKPTSKEEYQFIPGPPSEPKPQFGFPGSGPQLPPFKPSQDTPRTGTFGMQTPPAQPTYSTTIPGHLGFDINSQTIQPPRNQPQAGQYAQPPASAPVDSESRQQHEEAKRFARLLILEIKLYNEDKVMEGRKNKNLYSLLKEEIDRSQEVYTDRIGSLVSETKYFYEELVNILAGGDSSVLGI